MKRKLLAAFLSLVLHLAFFALVFVHLSPSDSTIPPPPFIQPTIEVVILPPNLTPPSVNDGNKADFLAMWPGCDTADNTGGHYDGVGFSYSPTTHLITDILPMYPAYKAGMRAGDYIVNPAVYPDKDGYITFQVNRWEKHFVFKVKTEKICYVSSNE